MRNNTVYDLMISAGVYTSWLGPDEQDYLEFAEGIQSFQLIPVTTQEIPGSIFEGDVKITAFDQSSGYDGQFPVPLAPQVVLYSSGPSQELGNFSATDETTTSEDFSLDSFMHTLFVFIATNMGSVDGQCVVTVTGSSGFVYFEGIINLEQNDGNILLTIPWIYVHDMAVTVTVDNETANALTVSVAEGADIYPNQNINGVPYVLVPRGTTIRDHVVTTGVAINLGSVSAVRGIKIQGFAANTDVITYGYSATDAENNGDELSPGQAHVLPLQNSDALWISGTANDGVTVHGV